MNNITPKSKLLFITVLSLTILSNMRCLAIINTQNVYAGSSISNSAVDIFLPQSNYDNQVILVQNSNNKAECTIDSTNAEKVIDSEKVQVYQANLTTKEKNYIANNKGTLIEENISFQASEEDVCITDELLHEAEPDNPDWNIDMIEGKDISYGQDQVKVAVMDSGVEGISDVTIKESVNLVENEQDLPPYMNDLTGHGTAVASIIHSIDDNADIYSVRILDSNNSTTLERLVRGIYWCINNDIDVINMSFGTPKKSEILEKALEDAENEGIVVVAAAGNSGHSGVEYPAASENTIAVGSIDSSAIRSDFSSTGKEIDVVAPGQDIEVETLFGLNTWKDGTSMSAPHVAAEASVLLSKDRNVDPELIKDIICGTAKDVDDDNCGQGVIDISSAEKCYENAANQYDVGDSVDIPETTNPVNTTNEEDIKLDAKWKITKHEADVGQSVTNLNNSGEYNKIYSPTLNIIKHGAVYSDHTKSSTIIQNGEHDKWYKGFWHGYFKTDNKPRVNYISCYRLITKVATYAGDTSKFNYGVAGMGAKGEDGPSKDYYNSFMKYYSPDKIANYNGQMVTYGTAIMKYYDTAQKKYVTYKPCEGLYSGSDAIKKRLRKAFLYGIAIHQGTDTFAHSTFNRSKKRIVHSFKDGYNESNSVLGADDPSQCTNRAEDAQAIAQRTIVLYLKHMSDTEGIGAVDAFTPAKKNRTITENYYLANVTNYADEASKGKLSAEVKAWFKKMNYTAS